MAPNKLMDISVDCVIFGFDENQLKILLIEHATGAGSEKHSRHALPGDLVFEEEDLDDAAKRVLSELTGIENIYMEQFCTFGNPSRVKDKKDQEWLKNTRANPEARVITVAYYSLVKMEDYIPKPASFASKAEWVSIHSVPTLAFDHNEILSVALSKLREQIKYHPIGFELLPKKFTLSQLQHLNEIILDKKLDKRNFRRKVQKLKSVIPLEEKQRGVLHKPARLFTYDKEKAVEDEED